MIEQAFNSFYKENTSKYLVIEQQEGIIKHLTHLEELILTRQKEGLDIAVEFIKALTETFNGNADSGVFTTVKYDGCIHPDTILITNEGPLTILDIINSDKRVYVRGHDFCTKTDVWVEAQKPRINNNNKNWVCLELENGEKLFCTEDHEIFTENRGWVPAKELNTEDSLKFIQKS